jgi:hypothetical protein
MRLHALSPALLAIAILADAPALNAQETATLAMRVSARDTGAPLAGAEVAVRDQQRRAVVGSDGWARIENLPAGQHIVTVRHLGYEVEHLLIQFAPGAVVQDRIALVSQPIALAPVEVTATRRIDRAGFHARKAERRGVYVERDEIEEMGHGRSTLSTVLRQLPGVRFYNAPQGRGLVVATTRGSRTGLRPGSETCYSQVILNGQVIVPQEVYPGGPQIVVIDDLVRLEAVEAIEWYRGPAQTPPEFNASGGRGGSAACGTVVIWTRDTT